MTRDARFRSLLGSASMKERPLRGEKCQSAEREPSPDWPTGKRREHRRHRGMRNSCRDLCMLKILFRVTESVHGNPFAFVVALRFVEAIAKGLEKARRRRVENHFA